ncbi:hypothetical protein K466DRAFT_594899 [Polyporus arcularius HHB13444]|uniref:Uncharacterized protein n=1 Tax=Polyporus arcularius HHB13444 TaxID=1314778 RepID=A0A5C3PSV9_9APHY|nr:hypothetical protein K466DRAFT_594899 [Polyporus arcularius HHB13444]
MSTRPINIDDADSGDIQYLTADLWNHQVGKPNYQEGTFSEGMMNAQAEFRFNGTGVMVYGVASPRPSGEQRPNPPSVSFSIDGGIPIPVVSDPDLQDTEYSHQFYDSHTLSPDAHVLSMNVTQAEDDWPFVLDYILYIPLNPVLQPGSSGVAPPAQASAAKTSPHAAAIAGGVAGGIMLLLTAVLYGYLRRKALMDKHGPSINAVRKAARPTVDLLDDDCKLPPPSPVLTAKSWADAESVSEVTPMEFRCRSTSLSTGQQRLLMARGCRHLDSDVGSERAISSQHSPPPTPSASTFSHDSRPSTAFHSVLTPPSAAYRTTHGPQISYRPATPSESSFSQSSRAGSSSTGPGASSMARQSEKALLLREQRQATFHADSGVRFQAGQTLPVDAVPVPVGIGRPPTPPPSSEASTSTSASLMDWKQQQQEKKRVSFGGSAISEVPPMYTVN